MKLPFRIQSEPGDEPVISVDGAFGAPGLNLSHWPGNATPKELRHDLSTGSALAFARLAPERQAELARGAVAVVNNHYDTDGLCAAFALLCPDEALPRAERLLAAAEAGDFFRVPSEEAFVVDAIVSAFADPERSPIAERLAGLADDERHALCTLELLARLPAILDGQTGPYEDLWSAPLAELRSDLADLAAAAHDELVHLDLSIFTAPHGRGSSRAGAGPAFDPGRHALFASTRADRALVLGPGAEGTSVRLVVNTTSWFDLAEGPAPPRPDLAALKERLETLESEHGAGEHRWQAQSISNAAPELWYGAPGVPSFAEHSGALRPSRIPPEILRREVIEALRAVWAFPD